MAETDRPTRGCIDVGGCYVYGVVALPCTPFGLLAGIEGIRVRLVAGDAFAALVHDVARPLPVDDADQLSQWVEAHHRILTAVMVCSPVVIPARLGTYIQGGDSAILAWLDDQQALLVQLAARLRGRSQFLVRLYWDANAARRYVQDLGSALNVPDVVGSDLPPGAAFLQGRRREKALGAAVVELAARYRERTLDVLRTSTSDLRLAATERSGLGRHAAALLDAACLIESGKSGCLATALEQLDLPSGMTVRLVGPWPAYDFAG